MCVYIYISILASHKDIYSEVIKLLDNVDFPTPSDPSSKTLKYPIEHVDEQLHVYALSSELSLGNRSRLMSFSMYVELRDLLLEFLISDPFRFCLAILNERTRLRGLWKGSLKSL